MRSTEHEARIRSSFCKVNQSNMPKKTRVPPTRRTGRGQRSGLVTKTRGSTRNRGRGRGSRAVREPHEDVAHTQSGVRGRAVRDRSRVATSRGLVREEEDARGSVAETQDYRNTRSRSAPREVTHEVDNEGSRRPGKRGRSSSTAGRSTRSTKRTAHSTSLTEADIPRIADAVIQAISTRSRENPHGDGNSDSADTENDTDDFTPSDTMETEFSSAALNDSTITSTPLSYEDWLPLWTQHLTDTPEVSAVPPSACEINTPLNTQNWHKCLCRHPNQELVSYFLKGLSAGFRIGLCTPVHSLHSAHKNLQGALLHPQVVDDYLQTELLLGRISGPFQKSQCSTVQISRFGVIPKHHQPINGD